IENLVCIVINVKHANCWLTTGLLGDSYRERGGAVCGENNTIVNSDNDCYAHLDRLPLPSRLLLTQPPLRISFPGKLVPREPLAKDEPHGEIKPLAIVQALPIIVPECLFVQVPEGRYQTARHRSGPSDYCTGMPVRPSTGRGETAPRSRRYHVYHASGGSRSSPARWCGLHRARTRRHGLRLHAEIHQALHTISAHR